MPVSIIILIYYNYLYEIDHEVHFIKELSARSLIQFLKFFTENADKNVRRINWFIRKGDTMNAKETIGIINNFSLWKIISMKERLEAIACTMARTRSEPDDEDVSDIIGEVYAG